MRFPHAYKGVKKLFVVEIISIISGLIGLTAAILAVVGANNENEALVAAAGTMALVSGIALIVAFVLQLVGLIQAGKDEGNLESLYGYSYPNRFYRLLQVFLLLFHKIQTEYYL